MKGLRWRKGHSLGSHGRGVTQSGQVARRGGSLLLARRKPADTVHDVACIPAAGLSCHFYWYDASAYWP